MLEQCCNYSKQCHNNVATLCCAKNRRCESSRVTSPLFLVLYFICSISHHQILSFFYNFVEMITNNDFYIFRVSFCKDGGKQYYKDVEL